MVAQRQRQIETRYLREAAAFAGTLFISYSFCCVEHDLFQSSFYESEKLLWV
jgi:hypothetical protein